MRTSNKESSLLVDEAWVVVCLRDERTLGMMGGYGDRHSERGEKGRSIISSQKGATISNALKQTLIHSLNHRACDRNYLSNCAGTKNSEWLSKQ